MNNFCFKILEHGPEVPTDAQEEHPSTSSTRLDPSLLKPLFKQHRYCTWTTKVKFGFLCICSRMEEEHDVENPIQSKRAMLLGMGLEMMHL